MEIVKGYLYEDGSRFKGEQFLHGNSEGHGYPLEVSQGRVALASFDATEIGHMDSCAMGNLFLSESGLPTRQTQMGSKLNSERFHNILAMVPIARRLRAD